jgi:hypothetical protein
VAKLRTHNALLAIRTYLMAQIPVEMTAIGLTSRIQDWLLGRNDPDRLYNYDACLIATIPERVAPLTPEQTIRSLADVAFVVRGSTEEEVMQRQIGYGDATINMVQADRTLGGAVFECTAWNPEIEMPAPGAKQTGITVVRLQIELNLLGG